MAYTPDPTLTSQPDTTVNAGTAAAEFQTLKFYLAQGLNFRNLLLNASFAVDQQKNGGSYTVAAASNTYVSDQWIWVAPLSGATLIRTNSFPFFTCLQATQDSTSPGSNNVTLRQRVEASRCANLLTGFTVSVSGWIWVNTTLLGTLTFTPSLNQATATNNFTSTSSVGVGTAGTFTANGTWQFFKQQITLTASAIGGLEFNLNVAGAGLQNAVLRFANIQVEVNNFASAFESRPYQTDLFQCQRFYTVRNFNQNKLVTGGATLVDKFTLETEMLTTTPTATLVINSGDTVTVAAAVSSGTTTVSVSDTKAAGTQTMAYDITVTLSSRL